MAGAPGNAAPKPPGQPNGRMAARDPFREMQALTQSPQPVIIDGGANHGNTILLFLKLFPNARIYAIEANPALIEELKQKTAPFPQVKVMACAIGAENKNIAFHITHDDGASSVLQPHPTVLKYHGEKVRVKTTREVSMVRLDSVISEARIDILKLDLQGCELDALKGCEGILERVRLIYTEIEFTELYNEQPLFSHIDLFLRSHGFGLLNFYNLWTHPDGQLTSGDAIYLKGITPARGRA
jgi:FkbM family methyltransferase